MSTPAYAQSLVEALNAVSTAMFEAAAEMPEEISKEHWLATKRGPGAWQAIYHLRCNDVTPRVRCGLFALMEFVEIRTALERIQKQIENLDAPPPDLRLMKMRRSA